MGWMPFPFTFLLRPLPVSRYCFTSVSPIPFFLLFFPSPLTFSEQVCRGASHVAQRKQTEPAAKVGGDQYTWRGERYDGTSTRTGPLQSKKK